MLSLTLVTTLLFAGMFHQPAPGTGRDVDVTAPDRVKLRATYYDPGKSGPGVVFFHQCSRERRLWDGLATELVRAGAHVLVLSPRGTEDSQGAVWDYDGSLDHALDYWRKNWSRDAESAYLWLTSQSGVDSRNMVAMGAGCGSFLALLTAQRHYPSVHGAVFFSDFDDDATRDFLGQSPQLAIFSAVSEQDPMSFAAAKEIHAISSNPANRLVTLPEHAHGIGLLEKLPRLQRDVIVWLETRFLQATDSRVAEILQNHERDRGDHLRGDAADLASRLPEEYVSVADGKLKRETRESTLKQFQSYFANRKHRAWDDLEPPAVRVSPSGDTAWAIFRVRSQYTDTKPDGSKQDGEFVCAWTSTYEKRGGRWLMTSVTSTFEPRDKAP